MGNPVLDAAFKRALIYAVVAFISAFGASWGVSQDLNAGVAAGIAAGCSTFLIRWGGEGGYDANRAANGKVNPGDVPEASSQVVVTKVAN